MLENVDITLKKDEVCYSKFNAVLVGKADEQAKDEGILYITKKRLIFKGKITLAFSIARIAACDSRDGKHVFRMENDNLITFETNSVLTPSVMPHIESIVKFAEEKDFTPLKENPAWSADRKWEKIQQLPRQSFSAKQRTKPAKAKRKSRKNKMAEDIISAAVVLLVIAALYYFFYS